MDQPISERARRETAQVDGVLVQFHDSGAPLTRTAERDPIVLLHGTGGTARGHFGYLFPVLELNQRVVALDFAPTAEQQSLTLDDLVAQARAVIAQSVGDRPVTLVGYSLGAVVAASLAARHPEAVRNLVLVAGWMKTDAQQQLRNRVWSALYEAGSPEVGAFTAFTAFSPAFLSAMPSGQLQAIVGSIRPGAFDAAQMQINRNVDIAAEVVGIEARTLVIGCTRDQMVPVPHSKALFGAIEDSRYYEVDCGHAIIFERPAELAQLIDQFNENPAQYAAGSRIPNDRP